MTTRTPLRSALILPLIVVGVIAVLGLPAASQTELDDSLNRESLQYVNTLALAGPTPSELAELRSAALPPEGLDPWRTGSSSAQAWALATAANLAGQQTELARLGLEVDAAVGRVEVSGLHYAAASNRADVVETRLRALVVDSFVNGESNALDKLTGDRTRSYIDTPVEVATETLTATQQRLESESRRGRSAVIERYDTADDVRLMARLQGYAADEARELDAAARKLALEHPISLRDRHRLTLEASGEAPDTVVVNGFRVSPVLAEPLAALLAAAAEEGIEFGGWGYRSTEEQVLLRLDHCGPSGFAIFDGPSPNCEPPTARPLHSEHEKGLAIDFTQGDAILSASSPGFLWLQENAATYGLFNLESEPWHWSTTGH